MGGLERNLKLASRPPVEVVVADANVLLSATVRDFLLDAAAAGAITVRWSDHIIQDQPEAA